jgi:hypothetical protein
MNGDGNTTVQRNSLQVLPAAHAALDAFVSVSLKTYAYRRNNAADESRFVSRLSARFGVSATRYQNAVRA